MIRDELRQVHVDFSLTNELVRRYSHYAPREDALRTARQVTGVTHYLSKMATGEARLTEGSWYGTAIVCIDEVTDELNLPLAGNVAPAFEGETDIDSLEIIEPLAEIARGDEDEFQTAVTGICDWQDASLDQLGDPSVDRVRQITWSKGGYSALANLHMVKEDVTPVEKEVILEFGYLMQLLDDYLDQPEDDANGVSTLYTMGEMDGGDLLEKIKEVEAKTGVLWGRSRAHRRFFDICRLHHRVASLENIGVPASKVCPWYL